MVMARGFVVVQMQGWGWVDGGGLLEVLLRYSRG